MGIDVAGDGGPAQHRRRGTGGTADDDVLRRRVFEIHGVDDRVADQRSEGQHCGQHVDEGDQYIHRSRADDEREDQRLGARQSTLRQRTILGARHQRVDAVFGDVVDGRSRTGGEADAERSRDQDRERHRVRCREEHADDRSKNDEADDTRLAQLGVVTPVAKRRENHTFGQHEGSDSKAARGVHEGYQGQ